MSVRIVLISDPHFGCENGDAVEAAIAATQAFTPDLVVVAGDLTFEGRSHEFAAAREWLARLPRPQIVTPGNHDTPVWNIPLRLFAPFGRYRSYVGIESGAVDLPGLMARSLNTARGVQPRLDWSKGAIGLAAVRKAIAQMESAGDALRVLACHHPLVEAGAGGVSGGVHRGMAAARLLAEAGVDLILSGHVHNPFAVSLPFGDGMSYAVGAGTLSRRIRGAPPCFSTIEANEASIRVEILEWTGRGLTPGASCELPRRRRMRPRAAGAEKPGAVF